MRHPTDGTLRRLVDEPVGVADHCREHVTGCPVCLPALVAAREDARAVGAALGTDPAADVDPLDIDAAWLRLSRAVAAEEPPRVTAPARRRRPALRSPVVAVAAVAALLTGAGAAAAADWLQIFRTDEVAPVTLTQSDLVALPDLDGYGELELVERADLRDVADAAAAEEVTGLTVPRVAELPPGVSGEPAFQAGERLGAEFTFSAARRRAPPRRPGRCCRHPRRGWTAAGSGWSPGPGSPRCGRPTAACRAWSWPARSPPPGTPRASPSTPRATTSCPCRACPPAWPTSCAASPATGPPCRCPCRPGG
jgi:hypothetical protein